MLQDQPENSDSPGALAARPAATKEDVIDYRFKSAKTHLYILDGIEQPQ